MAQTRVPRIAGPYVHVYHPQPDVFPGPDSTHFRAGQRYPDWVPNDHHVVKGPDGRWHAFGITHPAPPEGGEIHDGEWLAFHAAAPPGTLKQHLRDDAWEDLPKVLPPLERPGEPREHHAPFIVERDGLFHMIYGPNPMRLATSTDLWTWTPEGTLFSEAHGLRDPCVLLLDGRCIIIYVTGNSLLTRTSTDLRTWSAEPVEVFRMTRPGDPESPVLLLCDGLFYLFWCIYDGTHGPYDHRTFVFRSGSPFDFTGRGPIAEVPAHAPEVIVDEDGDWYLSSAEWPHRGVSVAPLAWE